MVFSSQGAKCTYAKEVDACMYELGAKVSLRAGFKSYGNRKVVWVLVDRKEFDETNKMLIENGAKPLEENLTLIMAVMKVAGSPPKPAEFVLSPRVTELGNKVYRFNTKSGKIACVSSIADPALKNYLSYAVWTCEPSELQDLTAAESSLDGFKMLKIGMPRDEAVRLAHCRDGVSNEFDLLEGEKAKGEKAIIRSCKIPIPKSQTNGKFRYIVFETWFVADKLFAVIPPIVKGPGGCIPNKPTSGSGVGGTKWCKEDE